MQRSNKNLALSGVELLDEDHTWLAATERLALTSVKLPAGLLARMEKLWWLDIRGGSGTDLEFARGATKLQYLSVNQIRGLQDLSLICEMRSLRYIQLYGLPKVTELPSFSSLVNLEHASLGQMQGLHSLHGLLEAPRLRELQLVRKINVNATDVDEIINHPAIKQFGWFWEDVPVKVAMPVLEKIKLPPVPYLSAEDWFETGRP
jgi:hypothetical protein